MVQFQLYPSDLNLTLKTSSCAQPGIVRYLKSTRSFQSFKKIQVKMPLVEKRHAFSEVHNSNYIHIFLISLLKTMDMNSKLLIHTEAVLCPKQMLCSWVYQFKPFYSASNYLLSAIIIRLNMTKQNITSCSF